MNSGQTNDCRLVGKLAVVRRDSGTWGVHDKPTLLKCRFIANGGEPCIILLHDIYNASYLVLHERGTGWMYTIALEGL